MKILISEAFELLEKMESFAGVKCEGLDDYRGNTQEAEKDLDKNIELFNGAVKALSVSLKEGKSERILEEVILVRVFAMNINSNIEELVDLIEEYIQKS